MVLLCGFLLYFCEPGFFAVKQGKRSSFPMKRDLLYFHCKFFSVICAKKLCYPREMLLMRNYPGSRRRGTARSRLGDNNSILY